MYAPNAPDPRPSNAADYTTEEMLAVVVAHPDADAILAGAFLDYARWLTNWSPPEFVEAGPSQRRRRGGVLYKGTKEWRRLARHKKSLR